MDHTDIVQTKQSTVDSRLKVLRESVAASIAFLIVASTSIMLYIVFTRYVASDDPGADKHFERAKDLLLLLNPLLGVVIGYYFNKVSTETRAEKAEATVASATNSAEHARYDAERAKSVLNDIVPAAQEVLSKTAGRSPGTLGIGESAPAMSEAEAALRAAIQRAKQIS